ncbi:UDP-glycosyltransferase UGT5-like [Diprion similis]|uniref:UDP-glycosyltransferase UGT5-like n=1 Tax=Diprion similis TaxID=362088 RepID=UPI001EF831E0|nr:UDP-glycosyltransferase UGT5-like [Diprion similis]
MAEHLISVALVLVVAVLHQVWASRILAICPTSSISHQIVFRGLTMALRDRGHELVVVTTDPVDDPTLKNYTEISINFLYKDFIQRVDFVTNRKYETWFDVVANWAPAFKSQSDRILNVPELRNLYAPDSGEEFDLLIVEALYWPAFLPLAKRFDVPVIGLTSLGLTTNNHYAIGNPVFSSHSSHWDAGEAVLGELTLWQRLKNFVRMWRYLYWYRTDYMPANQAIARKYFGNSVPDLRDLEKNISLIFVNQQAPISHVRPNTPKIIEIGGFHVSKQVKPLSKDLERILDNATQGFIYMSLGSNVKSAMLSDEIRDEFIATFSKLPYTVIWKFEDEFLPGRPDNVIIMKWTPQQSILAHPNIKAFIYQGGLQSTEEAISHGVPVIGLPVMSDQDTIIDKISSLGVGKKLEILDFNSEDLLDAIHSVVQDGSYKQRMLKLRDLVRDKPYDLMENAVWWTEHVIRHKGAPHLHSTTADDPWYQRQDMDLIFIISTAILIAFSMTLVLLHKLMVRSIFVVQYRLPGSKKDKLD